jgi:mono/diheme cytochrome c family protein
MRAPFIAPLLFALAIAAGASAEEPAVALKEAPGRDVTEANCGACHSLDYVRTNAHFMTAKTWEAEVAKMINVFGAAIDPADAKTITDYLVRNYGGPG